MPRLRRFSVVTVASVFAACGSEGTRGGDAAGGTLIISTAADADAILPPLVRTTVGAMLADQMFEPLAEIGDSLNVVGDGGFSPRLAKSWTWSTDSLSIAFAIDPNAKWQDGRPVRAQDVKFSHDVYVDPVIASLKGGAFDNVDSVSTPDSLTAVVWFKKRSPEQFTDFVYNLRVLPEHRLGAVARAELAAAPDATSPVGSGRFRFVRWERGATIELEADTTAWRGRPRLDRIVLSVAPDPAASVTRLFAGETDLLESIRGEAATLIKDNANARAVNIPGFDYGGVYWNLRDAKNDARPHPILGDRGVRRALAMGVDRAAIVRSVLDTLGVVAQGPFVSAQNFADPSVKALAYDQAAAKALLDSLGWKDSNGDGLREKNGRPMKLTLVVPTSSSARLAMSVILQSQFKDLGLVLDLDKVEHTAMVDRIFGSRTWDGLFMGYHPEPGSSGVAGSWSSRNIAQAGSNLSRYSNPAFDAQLDSAQTSYDAAKARAHFRQAFTILNDDAPAIFIYELRGAIGINKRLQPGYLRPDSWWSHLDDWSVPADQRIARDRVGLAK
jgi:peptide/nickel transport system substrate-binding protein